MLRAKKKKKNFLGIFNKQKKKENKYVKFII